MKQAVILHGTDGKPDSNWFPWLKGKLEEQGYEAWVPQLPESHVPSRLRYNDFLLNSGWDLTDSIVIGHSSGAVEVLNLLMDERTPHIKLGVMVSAWQHGTPAGMDPAQFHYLFPQGGFDYRRIRAQANKLAFVHSADDPYCPIEQAERLATATGALFTVIPAGQHLGANLPEFPQLWQLIEPFL